MRLYSGTNALPTTRNADDISRIGARDIGLPQGIAMKLHRTQHKPRERRKMPRPSHFIALYLYIPLSSYLWFILSIYGPPVRLPYFRCRNFPPQDGNAKCSHILLTVTTVLRAYITTPQLASTTAHAASMSVLKTAKYCDLRVADCVAVFVEPIMCNTEIQPFKHLERHWIRSGRYYLLQETRND